MPIKALALISGGLDSALAIKLLIDQEIRVEALHCKMGFGTRTEELLKKPGDPALTTSSEFVCRHFNIPLHTVDLSGEFLEHVRKPLHGYGAKMNPCVDCKILMFRHAKRFAKEIGAQFVITGEVLGQRPMTQHRQTLKFTERQSALTGFLLRPLSAKLLDPTVPEVKGWVDRSRLLMLRGRGRRDQVDLAEKMGSWDYPRPAGGCCHLLEPCYSRRLRDFLNYAGPEALSVDSAALLSIGRHFRVSERIKLIAGRNEAENEFLKTHAAAGHIFETIEYPGAIVLMQVVGSASHDDLQLASAVATRYSDAPVEKEVTVSHLFDTLNETLTARAVSEERLSTWRIT